jgi:hypothetical protein
VCDDPCDGDEDILMFLTQVRENIIEFCKIKNKEKETIYDELIEKLRNMFLENDILCTECAPNYLTITLSKKGALEIALRIEKNTVENIVTLYVITGVEQANGVPNYGNTSEYINNNRNDFDTLAEKTFGTEHQINVNSWKKRIFDPIVWVSEEECIATKCYEEIMRHIEKHRNCNA